MKKLALCLAALYSSLTMANVDTLKQNLNQKHPNIKIENIQATEMKGLYSGRYQQQMVYLNEDAEHIFVGSMIRLKDQKNLTKDLVIQNNTVDIKTLPLNDAIKTVRGNGQRQLIIFSDPNCPYCKTLESHLSQLKNVTIYTFIYPLKQQSKLPSQQVWCAANRELAWKNLIQKGQQPQATAQCNHPIDRNLLLGQKLGLQGTPTLIFENGFKVMGAHPAAEIEKIWKELGL